MRALERCGPLMLSGGLAMDHGCCAPRVLPVLQHCGVGSEGWWITQIHRDTHTRTLGTSLPVGVEEEPFPSLARRRRHNHQFPPVWDRVLPSHTTNNKKQPG